MADLSSLSLRHWIVRLGSKEALDDFGELPLEAGERVVRLRVVKPDGSERLLRHVYCPELTTATRTPSELLQSCVRIADTVRVFTLDRPDDLASLPELVARVERA